jgi:hypothetical protein
MLAQTTLRAVLGTAGARRDAFRTKKLSSDVQSIPGHTQGEERRNQSRRAHGKHGSRHRKAGGSGSDRRAKIIHAEAEFQASQTLVNAAKIVGSIPAIMQLRYLEALTEIGAEQNSAVADADRHRQAFPRFV